MLQQPWDGKSALPLEGAAYYGGLRQNEVKPTPESPLLKLGIDKIPPIITTAVLLDAKRRGILPGDVVYVHTGWGEHWRDPDSAKLYYTQAPGLSYDAAQYLGERRIVAVGLDTPFIDPVAEGMLQGKAGPAPGTPQGLPFAVHHHLLTQAGIHHIENAEHDELARDGCGPRAP